MKKIVAVGQWCPDCEVFEETGTVGVHDGRCYGCGCPEDVHQEADVVAGDWP